MSSCVSTGETKRGLTFVWQYLNRNGLIRAFPGRNRRESLVGVTLNHIAAYIELYLNNVNTIHAIPRATTRGIVRARVAIDFNRTIVRYVRFLHGLTVRTLIITNNSVHTYDLLSHEPHFILR